MPPKKAAVKGGPKPDGPTNGIVEEGCTLPLWDDSEVAAEHWGGDLTAQQVEQNLQFVDNEFPSTLESCFYGIIHGWKRPTGIFSPFKPMVFRPAAQVLQFGNPYVFDPETAENKEMLEEGDEQVETQHDVIALYRRMRAIVVPNPDGGDQPPGTPGTVESDSPSRRRARRRQYKGDPSFMRAYNSALLVIAQNQTAIPQGRYAWELIYPQSPTTGFPIYNAWGKYVVRLFFRGAYRRIVVDDRLPVDSNGDSILSVTDQKEIWPALLLKAFFKALGPQHERRVLEDPIFIMSCLLGGSMAERIPTQMKELRVADIIRKQTAIPSRWVLSCVVKPTKAHELGLEPKQLYNIMEARQYQNTLAVRLCGLGAQWKGKFAYNSPSWTSEVEDTLGTTRNKHELTKQWNDFWVPWEDFIEDFLYVYAMHPIIQDPVAYGNFKQLQAPDLAALAAAAAPTKPTRETPRNASAIGNAGANQTITAAADPYAPTVRWLSFKPRPDAIADGVMVQLGLGRPLTPPQNSPGYRGAATTPVGFLSGSGPLHPHPSTVGADYVPFSISVDRYNWRESGPFSNIISYTGPWDAYNTTPFVVPQSDETLLYRVTVRGLPPDAAISFMTNVELTLGEEKDILKEVSIYTATDAGKYTAHEPNMSTIWFKRWFSVKTPTIANFALKTLPRHTDITPFKMVLTDSTQPKAKGGAGAKGATPAAKTGTANGRGGAPGGTETQGNTPHPPSAPQSPIPLEEEIEELSVIDDASLSLLDLDSGEPVMKDSLAQILGAELVPNKLGYILTASAAPKVARSAGLWKLRITSNNPIEGVEHRSTDELHTRTGDYHHSTTRTIFNYNVTVAELTTASLQISLNGAPPNVAFLVKVIQGDKEILREAMSRCFIPHLTFHPPDKGQQNVCKLIGVLEADFAEMQEASRLAHVGERFEADKRAQAAMAEGLRHELLAKIEEEEAQQAAAALGSSNSDPNNMSVSGAAGEAPATPYKGVSFANGANSPGASTSAQQNAANGGQSPAAGGLTPPAAVGAPATLLDAAAACATAVNETNDTFGISYTIRIHASSTRLDLQEDQAANEHVNQTKASWARRDQPEGAPAAKGKPNAKNQTSGQDEAAARAAKAKEARLRYLANPTGVFIPFSAAGGTATSGMFKQPAADNISAYRVEAAAAADPDDLKNEREAAAEEVKEKSAQLLPTTQPGTAGHKSALTALLAKVEDRLADHAKARREYFTNASNLLMNSYDIKPQTTEVEDEKKKKKR